MLIMVMNVLFIIRNNVKKIKKRMLNSMQVICNNN